MFSLREEGLDSIENWISRYARLKETEAPRIILTTLKPVQRSHPTAPGTLHTHRHRPTPGTRQALAYDDVYARYLELPGQRSHPPAPGTLHTHAHRPTLACC